MFEDVLSKHRLDLQMHLTPEEIDALQSATPQTLLSILQGRTDRHVGRLIDRLIIHRYDYPISELTAELLTQFSLKQWIQSLADLPNDEIVNILTGNHISDNSTLYLDQYSVLNFPISFEDFNSELIAQLGQILQKLNRTQKRKVLLSSSQSRTPFAFLILAANKGYADEVLAALNDPELTAEMQEFLHIYEMRRLAAHFLGIQDEGQRFTALTNQSTGVSQGFKYQGWQMKQALAHFRAILNKYEPNAAFADEFKTIIDAYYRSEDARVEQHAKDYAEGKWIVLPTGWPGHAVFIAANQSLLVVANRGMGKHPKGGCIVHKLNKPLTDTEIQAFLEMESQTKVEETIKNATKSEAGASEFVALPLKEQKYGNCCIANQKALVAGLLAVLGVLKNTDQNPNTDENKAAIQASNREYKRFTQYTRTQVIDILIKGLDNPKLQSDLLKAIRQYLAQHGDLEKQSERQLVFDLLQKMPNDILDAMLETMKPNERKLVQHAQRVKKLQQNNGHLSRNEMREMLSDAIEYNQKSIVLELLKRANLINAEDNQGRTPLIHAAALDNLEMVKLLLQNAADVNAQDRQENTALTHIIINIPRDGRDLSTRRKHIIADLVSKMHHMEQGRNKALKTAMSLNQYELVRQLILKGCPHHLTFERGTTILMWAVQKGYMDAALKLIEDGADVTVKDDNGYTAIDHLRRDCQKELALALELATLSTPIQRIKRFLKAARGGNKNHALALLSTGVDINCANLRGTTALMAAAEDDEMEMVTLLIANGANCHLVNKEGKTAYQIAIDNDHQDLANLIEKAIIDENERQAAEALMQASKPAISEAELITHRLYLREQAMTLGLKNPEEFVATLLSDADTIAKKAGKQADILGLYGGLLQNVETYLFERGKLKPDESQALGKLYHQYKLQEAAILDKCGFGRIDSDTQNLIDAHISQINAAAAIQSPLPQKAKAITHQAKKSNPPSDTKQQSSSPHQSASSSQPFKKK